MISAFERIWSGDATEAEYAGLFPQAELAVQPGGGHLPWRDDPEWFVQTLTGFLG